jgi:hypothetical protein
MQKKEYYFCFYFSYQVLLPLVLLVVVLKIPVPVVVVVNAEWAAKGVGAAVRCGEKGPVDARRGRLEEII